MVSVGCRRVPNTPRSNPSWWNPTRLTSRSATEFSSATITWTRPSPKVVQAPFCEQPQSMCRSAATALGLDDSAAQFADVVLGQAEHHFTEIGVVVGRGDHEVEHLAGNPAVHEVLGHLRGVSGGKRLDARLTRRVHEHDGTFEVVRPEWTQRNVRPRSGGSGYGIAPSMGTW